MRSKGRIWMISQTWRRCLVVMLILLCFGITIYWEWWLNLPLLDTTVFGDWRSLLLPFFLTGLLFSIMILLRLSLQPIIGRVNRVPFLSRKHTKLDERQQAIRDRSYQTLIRLP